MENSCWLKFLNPKSMFGWYEDSASALSITSSLISVSLYHGKCSYKRCPSFMGDNGLCTKCLKIGLWSGQYVIILAWAVELA